MVISHLLNVTILLVRATFFFVVDSNASLQVCHPIRIPISITFRKTGGLVGLVDGFGAGFEDWRSVVILKRCKTSMTKLVAWVVTLDACWFFWVLFGSKTRPVSAIEGVSGMMVAWCLMRLQSFSQKWRITLVEISYGKKGKSSEMVVQDQGMGSSKMSH